MEFVTIDQSEPVSQLIGKMSKQNTFQACILNGDRVVGIFDPQLLKSRVDIAEIKCKNVARSVHSLGSEHDMLAIASHMHNDDALVLPIERDGGFAGGMHILKVLELVRKDLDIAVKQVHHLQPIAVQETDRIDTALSIMHDERIDRLPVLSDEKVVGFLSYQDLLLNYYSHHMERDMGQAPKSRTRAFRAEMPVMSSLPVSNAMSRGDIFTINEDDSVETAIDSMIAHNVLSLLILDDGKLLGMITARDILEAFIHKKTPMNETANESIQFVGLEEMDIDDYLKQQVKKTAAHHASRLVHYFSNEYQFTVHIKEYSRTGHRHKFSVNLRVTYPGATVPVTEAHAWNIRTAVQEAFGRLEQHLAHTYKGNKKENYSERHGREIPAPGNHPAQSI